MSIKNILVALAPDAKNDAGRDVAISMAAALKAQLTARIYALEPQAGVNVFGGLPGDILKVHRATVSKEAEAAAAVFAEKARAAKIQFTHAVARATLSAATAEFGREARVHDVSVVTQSSEGLAHFGDTFTEAALFYSGRPVIVVPKKHRREFSLNRILIAWDGNVHAARAVSAAMPLLAAAKSIDVLVVGDKTTAKRTLARDLLRSFDRHGFDAELTCRDEQDVAEAIAREAKVSSASLIVMGGYGHTRMGEWLFGGVTRFMLTQASLPVLMAH